MDRIFKVWCIHELFSSTTEAVLERRFLQGTSVQSRREFPNRNEDLRIVDGKRKSGVQVCVLRSSSDDVWGWLRTYGVTDV